jgi:hypothetical protein
MSVVVVVYDVVVCSVKCDGNNTQNLHELKELQLKSISQ